MLSLLRIRPLACLAVVALLAGCAANKLPGYQNTFQGYNVPQPLLDRISAKFREHGLTAATIGRDNVGRVRLLGAYRNEDEVDRAFVIVQSIVGIKSTSPFYPQDVKEKNWEREASGALADFAASRRRASGDGGQGVRRALVVGISLFRDPHIQPIPGEADAQAMAEQLERFGYQVTRVLGRAATKAGIEAAVARMEAEVGPDDNLFIFVSSHGEPPIPSPRGGDERKMSIIAYDTGDGDGRPSKDEPSWRLKVHDTAVKDSVIQRLAQRPTRVTRVVIDTCYSGELLRGTQEDSRQYIHAQNGGMPERAGVSLASWSGPAFVSKGIQFAPGGPVQPVQAATKSAKPAAAAPRSRPGYTLITASSEGERSYAPAANGDFVSPVGDGRKLRGSFFTQSFAGWLELHSGKVQPAYELASRFTTTKVDSLSQGKPDVQQHPRIFSTLTAEDDVLSRP